MAVINQHKVFLKNLGHCFTINETDDGKPFITESNSRGSNDVQSWIDHGLVELVGEPGKRDQRMTPSDHPEFISRAIDYLVKYGFFVKTEPYEDT